MNPCEKSPARRPGKSSIDVPHQLGDHLLRIDAGVGQRPLQPATQNGTCDPRRNRRVLQSFQILQRALRRRVQRRPHTPIGTLLRLHVETSLAAMRARRLSESCGQVRKTGNAVHCAYSVRTMQFARLWRAVGRLTVLAAAGTILSDATTLVAVWSPQQLLIGADSNVITSIPNVI